MRFYELVVVFSPKLSEDQVTEEVGKVKGLLADNGATDIEAEQWGRREIAYKLAKGKEEQGVYICFYYATDSAETNERATSILRITESALLYQIHRIEGRYRKFKGRKSFKISEEDLDPEDRAA